MHLWICNPHDLSRVFVCCYQTYSMFWNQWRRRCHQELWAPGVWPTNSREHMAKVPWSASTLKNNRPPSRQNKYDILKYWSTWSNTIHKGKATIRVNPISIEVDKPAPAPNIAILWIMVPCWCLNPTFLFSFQFTHYFHGQFLKIVWNWSETACPHCIYIYVRDKCTEFHLVCGFVSMHLRALRPAGLRERPTTKTHRHAQRVSIHMHIAETQLLRYS